MVDGVPDGAGGRVVADLLSHDAVASSVGGIVAGVVVVGVAGATAPGEEEEEEGEEASQPPPPVRLGGTAQPSDPERRPA